jgi:hypothetical protein
MRLTLKLLLHPMLVRWIKVLLLARFGTVDLSSAEQTVRMLELVLLVAIGSGIVDSSWVERKARLRGLEAARDLEFSFPLLTKLLVHPQPETPIVPLNLETQMGQIEIFPAEYQH